MVNLDGVYRDPNGGAYAKLELREGPPLSYIAEKLHSALCQLHALNWKLTRYAERHPMPAESDPQFPGPADITSTIGAAFRYAAISFCALNNALAHANPADFHERLLEMSSGEFASWLDDIERGGTISGGG